MVIESKSFQAKRKTTSCPPIVGFFIAASGSGKRKGGAGTKPHVHPSEAPNHVHHRQCISCRTPWISAFSPGELFQGAELLRLLKMRRGHSGQIYAPFLLLPLDYDNLSLQSLSCLIFEHHQLFGGGIRGLKSMEQTIPASGQHHQDVTFNDTDMLPCP